MDARDTLNCAASCRSAGSSHAGLQSTGHDELFNVIGDLRTDAAAGELQRWYGTTTRNRR
jgi:hypothetical protein